MADVVKGASHFCAGIFVVQKLGVWFTVVGSDSRFPGDRKLLGGTNEGKPDEIPLKTLERELQQEAGVLIDTKACILVHTNGTPTHRKRYFVVPRWHGEIALRTFKDGRSSVTVTLAEINPQLRHRLFKNHLTGFKKGLTLLAEDNPVLREQVVKAGLLWTSKTRY